MSEIRKLENPPIIEAVIDLQFQPFIEVNEGSLKSFALQLENDYKRHDYLEFNEFEFKFDLSKMPEFTNIPSPFYGIKLYNDVKGFIVQLLRERISISKSKNYNNFEELQNEAGKIYQLVLKEFHPDNISRIGLRYINEITLKTDYQKYLEFNPFPMIRTFESKIARTYHQTILEFNENEGAIINFVVDLSKNNIIIDVDCFDTSLNDKFDICQNEDILHTLRNRKNLLFFDMVTHNFEDI